MRKFWDKNFGLLVPWDTFRVTWVTHNQLFRWLLVVSDSHNGLVTCQHTPVHGGFSSCCVQLGDLVACFCQSLPVNVLWSKLVKYFAHFRGKKKGLPRKKAGTLLIVQMKMYPNKICTYSKKSNVSPWRLMFPETVRYIMTCHIPSDSAWLGDGF